MLLSRARILQLCGYAVRAKRLLGRAGKQSLQAKRYRLDFYKDVWREAASELGAAYEELGGGIIQITCNGASTRVHTNCTVLDDPITLRVALDKSIVSSILRSNGLPVPDQLEFSLADLNKAYQFLARHRICVVKPADGTDGGGGVTTGIKTRFQLFSAAVRASGYSSRFLVEEQVKGDIVRLLYLDGRLLDAVRRSAPTVLGDGKSRISQLVAALNQKRVDAGYHLAQSTIKHDMEMDRTLAEQNLSWRSVPAKGQRVTLKTVVNDNMADENDSVADLLSESTIAAGRRGAELIGARLAGVDIITPDIGQGLEAAGGKILEINTTPGYHYHYFKRDGICRVAVPILETCLEHARRGRESEAYVRS